MKFLRHTFRRQRPGVLLLEAVLGTALLVVFLGALAMAVYNGQGGTKAGGDRGRATQIANQTMDGARSIGLDNYATLYAAACSPTPCPKGVVFNQGTGKWEFQGTSTTTNGYTSALTVSIPSADDADTVKLSVTVSWNIGPNRAQSLALEGLFTNWRKKKDVGDWSGGINILGQYTAGVGANFDDVTVIGNYAYVGDAGNKNVLILNIKDLNNITSVGTIDLSGETPTSIAAKGTLLYVITNDAGGGYARAYNAQNPTSPTLLVKQAIPIQAGMTATSLAIAGDYLYVGAK